MIASAEYHPDGGLALRTPYKKEFVDALKDAIPASARIWDADDKIWIVSGGYEQYALRLLRLYYPDAVIGEPPSYRRPNFTVHYSEPKNDPDRELLFVTRDAPEVVIRAAYRALAKLAHPDAGGDTERMRALNDAFERLIDRTRSQGAA